MEALNSDSQRLLDSKLAFHQPSIWIWWPDKLAANFPFEQVENCQMASEQPILKLLVEGRIARGRFHIDPSAIPPSPFPPFKHCVISNLIIVISWPLLAKDALLTPANNGIRYAFRVKVSTLMYPLLCFSDRDHDGGELLSLRIAGVSGTGLGSDLISVLTLITWSLHVHRINYHMMGYHRCPYSILKSFRESTHRQVWSHHWIMFPMTYLSGKGRSVQHTATRNSIVAPTVKGSWSHAQR